jgi:hypothetical protein
MGITMIKSNLFIHDRSYFSSNIHKLCFITFFMGVLLVFGILTDATVLYSRRGRFRTVQTGVADVRSNIHVQISVTR